LLELDEFVSALTRMAAEKLPSVEKRGGLASQLEAFLSRYCGEQVQSFIDDALEVDALLDDREVLMVLYRSRPRLHVIFAAYAIAARDREKNKLSEKQEAAAVAAIMAAHHADHAITGASVGEAFQKLTLDFPAWHAMMRDGRMLDRDFTQREATTIFVKINLAEELYQVNPPATGEATVCYDEWELMVVALVREKVGCDAGEPFATSLESFLLLIFIPAYRSLLKPKGIDVPLAREELEGTALS